MMDVTAYRFALELRTLREPATCADLFRTAIVPYGYDTFACGEIDLNNRDRSVFYLIDWPERWRQFYVSSGLIYRDPVVESLSFRDAPFTWQDLRADRRLAAVGGEALDKVAQNGWDKGFVVPIAQGGSRRGLVSLAGNGPAPDEHERAFLFLISSSLHQHMRMLVATAGFAAPPMGLTEREIAAIRLVARGAPEKKIALALDIAVSTAHEFVEKAKYKLGVHSRAELASVAALLGVIAL